jgi:protein tyrosine phosphatase (PTP) superfamily phosphohydrolase (DUF442 family)
MSRRLARASLIIFLLSTTVASREVLCQSDGKPHRSSSEATRLRSSEITNFAQVSPNLLRGGQPSDKGLAELKKMGVSIIVDMRTGVRNSEKGKVTKMGMQYLAIPWHCPFPRDPAFAEFLKVIEDNPQKKVFVHCRLGDDRTGMAVAAYRMAEQGWSADQAMREMQQFGFDWTHHAICPGLAGYEKGFPQRLRKEKAFKDLRGWRDQSK